MAVEVRPRKLGLALSGGALKASAHVGVLSALNDMGIYPDCVAGTSAGAFVAALYAHGLREAEFMQLLRNFPGRKLLDYGFPVSFALWNLASSRWLGPGRVPKLPGGLLRGRRLKRYMSRVLRSVVGGTNALPYYVIATDLWTGQPVTFSNDVQALEAGLAHPIADPAEVVLASCSLPGIFGPVRHDPWLLTDGACRDYVPVQVLRDVGCDQVIAVNLHTLADNWTPQTFVHVLSRSYEILLQDAVEHDVDEPGVYVLSPVIEHFTWLSFDQMQSGVAAGRAAVQTRSQQIEAFLNKVGPHSGRRQSLKIHLGTSAHPLNNADRAAKG